MDAGYIGETCACCTSEICVDCTGVMCVHAVQV